MCVGRRASIAPERIFPSIAFSPAALTRTRTCPGPGRGNLDFGFVQHIGAAETVELDGFHDDSFSITTS